MRRSGAAWGNAVADGCRYADDDLADQAAENARQGGVHPGDGYDDVMGADLLDPLEHPPKSGDTDIDEERAGDPHEGERAFRFACNFQICRARRDNSHATLP